MNGKGGREIQPALAERPRSTSWPVSATDYPRHAGLQLQAWPSTLMHPIVQRQLLARWEMLLPLL